MVHDLGNVVHRQPPSCNHAGYPTYGPVHRICPVDAPGRRSGHWPHHLGFPRRRARWGRWSGISVDCATDGSGLPPNLPERNPAAEDHVGGQVRESAVDWAHGAGSGVSDLDTMNPQMWVMNATFASGVK